MIIFLYGQDNYRSQQKLNEIIDRYKKIHKSGLSLKYFNGVSLNNEDVKNEVQTTSMFKEKKLIVLKNIIANQKSQEKLSDFFKKLKDLKDIILIHEEKDPDKKSLIFKLLKKYSTSQEFKPLEGVNLKNWLRKEFTNYRVTVSQEVLEKLVDFVGNNLWQMHNEVKKLVNFKLNKKIEVKDVELLVRSKIDSDIFTTIDAIALKSKKRALSLIHKHLEKGDNPLYLLSMISFQFRNLLIIKNLVGKYQSYYAIEKKTKLHPFVVKKSYHLARRFNFQDLKKIYQKILQIDWSIKKGRMNPEAALDLLITSI